MTQAIGSTATSDMARQHSKGARRIASTVTVVVLLALGLCTGCTWLHERKPERQVEIQLVDAGGAPLGEFELASNLHVGLRGLRPRTMHDIVLTDPGDEVVSWARLTSDASGDIEPFVLWYQTGVIGCTRGTESLRGAYYFRSYEEAERSLAARPLRLEVRRSGGATLARSDVPVARSSRSPVLHAGNAEGCLLNGVVEGKEDVYAVGRGFPAGSIVEIYTVESRQRWPLRAPLRDIRGPNWARDVLTVQLRPDQTEFVARLWSADEIRVGSYDLVARHYLEGEDHAEWDFLEAGDLVSYPFTSAFVVQQVWGMDPHLSEEIAGRVLPGFPYFEHVDGFERGQDVWGAIDPKKKSASNPFTYAAWYVVDAKPAWNDGDTLVDVTGGAEITPIQPGCINGTLTRLWQNPSPSGLGPSSPTKAYDVVIDFGAFTPGAPITANGTYTIDVDFIDRVDMAGFHLIDDPRASGPFQVGSLDLDQGCDWALDTSVSWTNDLVSTPVTVPLLDEETTWREPCNMPGDPLFDPTQTARMRARIQYPKAPGASTAVASGGPFPLVLFLHGQQGFGVSGHTGYDYLMTLFASHGFIGISIDGNDLLDSQIFARGELVREWLRRMRDRNASGGASIGGVSFVGAIDLSKVVVVGHSRGGEAVVAAHELQRVAPDTGYTIVGIVPIAPTQGIGHWWLVPGLLTRLKDVPFLILQGAKDGDLDTALGIRFYDRAEPFESPGNTPRQLVYIRDANHDFFNTSWITPSGLSLCTCDRVPNPLDPAQQQAAAQIYIRAFLEAYVRGRSEYRSYFTGVIPPSVSPPIEVVTSYQPGAPDSLTIEHHEESNQALRSATQNTLGGSVTATSLGSTAAPFGEYQLLAELPFASLRLPSDPGHSSDTTVSVDPSFPHTTHGALLRWNASTDAYAIQIPASCTVGGTLFSDCRAQVAGFTHLSMRVGQVFRASANQNPLGLAQDFSIRAKDADGDASPWIRISKYATLPFPWEAEQASGASGPKSVLGTVRVPLAAFTVNSSQVDLFKLETIEFRFDRTPQGELAIDDIELVR